jgi:hypothetical protein
MTWTADRPRLQPEALDVDGVKSDSATDPDYNIDRDLIPGMPTQQTGGGQRWGKRDKVEGPSPRDVS